MPVAGNTGDGVFCRRSTAMLALLRREGRPHPIEESTVTRLTLSALLFVALPAMANDVQVVDVQLDSYRFIPDRIVVQANRPVRLRATNVAGFIPHSLVIKAPDAGIDVNLVVRAGKTGEASFTPTAPGTFEMICDKQPPIGRSHRDKGMHGVLVVE